MKIVKLDFRVVGSKKQLPKINVVFQKIEVTDGVKQYGLTNYEANSFEYNVETKEILNPETKISVMNGKEYIFTATELFAGENKSLLDKMIQDGINEEEQKTNVPDSMLKEIMHAIKGMHEKHAVQACINLLDKSLVDKDIDLFQRMSARLNELNNA